MVRNVKPELIYFHNLIFIKYYLIPIKSLGSVRCFGKKMSILLTKAIFL